MQFKNTFLHILAKYNRDYHMTTYAKVSRQEPCYYESAMTSILNKYSFSRHGVNVNKSYSIPSLQAWYTSLFIHTFLVQNGICNKLGSQVDIFPTATFLAGISYNNSTLDRNSISITQESWGGGDNKCF